MRFSAVTTSLVPLLLVIPASVVARTPSLPKSTQAPVMVADTSASTSPIAQKPVEAKSWQNVRLVRTLPDKEFETFAFSPDGQILATGSRRSEVISTASGRTISPTKDISIKLWNLNTGELIRTINYYSPANIKSLAFSPNGQILGSSAYSDNKVLTIKLWDLKTGQELQTMRSLVEPKVTNYPGGGSSTSDASKIVFSSDGQSLISTTGGSSSIQVWQVKPQSNSSKNLDGQLAGVNSIIAPVPTKTKAVSRTKVDPKAEQAKTDLYVMARTVLEELGTDTPDGTRTFTGQGYFLSSKDNNFTIAADGGRRVIFQMRDGKFDSSMNLSARDIANFRAAVEKILNQGLLRQTLIGHTDEVTSVAFTQDGQFLISGSADKSVKLWNLKTGQLIRTLRGHTKTINTLAISPDNQFIASGGSDDTTIKLWNLKTGQLIRTFADGGQVGTVRFTPEGKNLIAVSLVPNSVDRRIQAWDAGTGKLVHRSQNINWRAGISVSPDGKNYAIAGNGINSAVLDLMTDKTIFSFSEQQWVSFTPDGKSLVTASQEGIKVWQ